MNKIEQPTSSFAFKVEDLMHHYNQTVVQQKAFGLALTQGTSGVYRVSGVVYTDSNPNFSITSGYVFHNEELFEVEAWSGVAVGAQVPVWELHEVDGAHEPHNLYIGNSITGTQAITKVRKLRPRLDASGTGIANIADTKELPLVRLNDLYGLQSGMMVPYGKDFSLIASQFDGTGLGFGLFEGFAICNGNNGTIDMRQAVPAGYDATSSDFNVVGKESGANSKTLIADNLPPHNHPYKDAYYIETGTGTAVDGHIDTGVNTLTGSASSDNNNQNLYYRNATTDNQGNAVPFDNKQKTKAVVWLMKL